MSRQISRIPHHASPVYRVCVKAIADAHRRVLALQGTKLVGITGLQVHGRLASARAFELDMTKGVLRTGENVHRGNDHFNVGSRVKHGRRHRAQIVNLKEDVAMVQAIVITRLTVVNMRRHNPGSLQPAHLNSALAAKNSGSELMEISGQALKLRIGNRAETIAQAHSRGHRGSPSC
ncbi:MAG: hypothetical protein EKK48_10095 [Candidatus Melainabacteria bacterium]|nr:MAG: hypothetical protein EKK48_10095 [Candidatus Melainabacteria bacterium]